MTLTAGRRGLAGGVAAVVCCAGGLFTAWALSATEGATGDPFDSSLFWWLWIVLPSFGVGAGALWPAQSHRPVWTAAFFGPIVVLVALSGTLWHEPDDGASLWFVGEVFIVALWAGTFAASFIGSLVRLARLPPPPRTP